MVSHTRLQYYNYNLCLVCLTGLFGCRWHRYKQSTDETKKKDLLCFALLVAALLYVTFFFYYWLMQENYADWMNSYFYDNTGSWYRYYSLVFILTCVAFAYVVLIMLLALCHVGHGYEIYMHWVHKIVVVLTIVLCIVVTVALDSVWKEGWSLQSLSLRITSPFLHVAAVAVMTVLTWLIASQWMKLYGKMAQVFWLSVYIAVMLGLYIAPVFIDSPCVVESRDLPGRPRVQAHRGASAMSPENTLISFQLASNYTTKFETDVTVSSDGIPFLMHDSTLRRTTNVQDVFPDRVGHSASYFTMAELKQLDAGTWFVNNNPQGDISSAPSWARSKYAGQEIPTLAELLQIMKGMSGTLMFDLKLMGGPDHPHYTDYADIVIKTILDSGMPQEQILWLYLESTLFNLTVQPNFTFVAQRGQHNVTHLKEVGIHMINAEHDMVSLHEIEYYHSHNISINIYLVNSKWLYSLYWCAGVDSVTSNFVHRLAGMSAPVWHLSPAEFKAMWITTNVLSVIIVITIFVIQRIRNSSSELFHADSLTFEGPRISMNRMRRSQNMKEKLLHTADIIQEVDTGGGVEGLRSVAPTPAMENRFSHGSCSDPGEAVPGENRLSTVSDATNGSYSTNRFSGISGLSAISGLATVETNTDTRSFSDTDYRLSQASDSQGDILT